MDFADLSIRIRQGDNKWYASFGSYNIKTVAESDTSYKGTTPVPNGEVWNVSNYYYFDYNPTLYGTTAATTVTE